MRRNFFFAPYFLNRFWAENKTWPEKSHFRFAENVPYNQFEKNGPLFLRRSVRAKNLAKKAKIFAG